MIIDTLYHHINEKDFTDIEALLYKAGYFNNNDFSNLPKFTKDNSIEFKNPKEKIIEDYVLTHHLLPKKQGSVEQRPYQLPDALAYRNYFYD